MFCNSINSLANAAIRITGKSKQRVYTLNVLPTLTGNVSAICMSNDRTRAYATIYSDKLHCWTSATNTWSHAQGVVNKTFQDIACSGDGQYVIAINWVTSGASEVYYSSDFGQTFNASASTFGIRLTSVAMSDNGQYAYIGSYENASSTGNNRFYVSTDYGVTWTSSVGANIPAATVKCNASGQNVILYGYVGSGTSAPGISTNYGASFIKPGGGNAGQFGTKPGINAFGNLAWYFFSFTGGNWTALSKQQLVGGTTLQSINCNSTPSATSASPGFRFAECTSDAKTIITIDNIPNGTGNVYLNTNGIASAPYGNPANVYSSEFTSLQSLYPGTISTGYWKDIYCSNNDDFIFVNGVGNIFTYTWTLL